MYETSSGEVLKIRWRREQISKYRREPNCLQASLRNIIQVISSCMLLRTLKLDSFIHNMSIFVVIYVWHPYLPLNVLILTEIYNMCITVSRSNNYPFFPPADH